MRYSEIPTTSCNHIYANDPLLPGPPDACDYVSVSTLYSPTDAGKYVDVAYPFRLRLYFFCRVSCGIVAVPYA